MGMFDDITLVPAIKCRKCGHIIAAGWQSKDGPCQLEKLPYWHVRNFYTFCRGKSNGKDCGEWHEYTLREPQLIRPISDYDLSPARETACGEKP